MRFPGLKVKEKSSHTIVEVDANRSDTDISSQTVAATVTGWPIGPQRITSAPIWIIGDLLLLLLPIAFLVLAAFAYKLDGEELSDRGRKIQQAILLGPTLFPLAFAALAGRSLKKIALWRAQEGTTLGFLEHVIGSQSLVAAIGHAITLHSLNFLTLGLLAIWALSPLGGQSALRLVHETNNTVLENRPVFYANVDAASDFPVGGNNVDAFNLVNSVVSTALLTVDTLEWSPTDTWNHPKIPRLEELEQSESRNDTNRSWYNVDPQANHSYAALTGVDVVNLSKSGATNLTIPYEYMYFGCDLSPQNNLTTTEAQGVSNTFPNYRTQLKYLHDLDAAGKLESYTQFLKNATISLAPKGSLTRSFFFYTRGSAIKPDALIYGSKMVGLTYYLFECSMKSVMVEANIICKADSCGVERLRRLNVDRKIRNGRYLPYDVVNDGYTARMFVQYLASIGGENSIGGNNPVDAYIYGHRPFGKGASGTPMLNWTSYIADPQRSLDMSHRLTRFANTYWDASRWPLTVTRNDPFEGSLDQTSHEPSSELRMNRTEAVVMRQVAIYRANAGWVACLVVCSCVLLLLGIFSFFLSLRITAPDIFDYVSSFTRDNPYVNAPHGGSGLDGAERARLLRKLPVQLGDVDAGAETGYITLKSIDGDTDRKAGKVKRERMYR
ncbi:hypothetical protein CC86DRAFT_369384 [Ophiobolus disseminans]|uniref:Uncharacterized protein n=1 Tax=Ophiobolus disseminans TaxID=1469910 RepID=A0A6A7A2Z3_9PLEO|nr:hypothetical protein CC86DRAFT_369384 [Ophiobolus disseminans]